MYASLRSITPEYMHACIPVFDFDIINIESANYALVNCNYQNDSIEMSFESDGSGSGTLCNLFVNATKHIVQCLEDIELVNNSKHNIPYSGKFSREKTFVDRWKGAFRRENFRGMLKLVA